MPHTGKTDTAVKSSSLMPNLDNWLLSTEAFGTVLKSYGMYVEDQMRAETLEYNAFLSEREAVQIGKHRDAELHKAKTIQRKLLASQIAATAASGRQFSGSPLDVMARSESEALIDQGIIRSNAAVKIGRARAQAVFDRLGAKDAKKGALERSLSSLLIEGGTSYNKSFAKKKKG